MGIRKDLLKPIKIGKKDMNPFAGRTEFHRPTRSVKGKKSRYEEDEISGDVEDALDYLDEAM